MSHNLCTYVCIMATTSYCKSFDEKESHRLLAQHALKNVEGKNHPRRALSNLCKFSRSVTLARWKIFLRHEKHCHKSFSDENIFYSTNVIIGFFAAATFFILFYFFALEWKTGKSRQREKFKNLNRKVLKRRAKCSLFLMSFSFEPNFLSSKTIIFLHTYIYVCKYTKSSVENFHT